MEQMLILNEYRVSLLMLAASKGFSDICQLLLDYGACVGDISASGISALMLAVEARSFKIAKLLLRNGSSIQHRDNNGNSVLHHAIPCSNQLLRLLLGHGSNVNVMNSRHVSPLMAAGSASNCGNSLLLAKAGAYFYPKGISVWNYFTKEVKSHLIKNGFKL